MKQFQGQKMRDYNVYTVRVSAKDDLVMDKLSYLTKLSKAELTRRGIKKIIEDHKNILQRSDIVIS